MLPTRARNPLRCISRPPPRPRERVLRAPLCDLIYDLIGASTAPEGGATPTNSAELKAPHYAARGWVTVVRPLGSPFGGPATVGPYGVQLAWLFEMQQRLDFFPLPQGHGLLRPRSWGGEELHRYA